MCLKYIVTGGGFLISIDTTSSQLTRSSPVPYQKISSTKTICYHYDETPPLHCLENEECNTEPLQLETRISRTPNIDVTFEGWFDPVPEGGQQADASSIESYQITVNEVSGPRDALKVSPEVMFTRKIPSTGNNMTLNITSDRPALFCVTLEIKDIADNVRQARRFFLYDNTTFISSRSDKPFYINSAAKNTDYLWQNSHGDICLNWTDHFCNRFYHDNPLLSRIEPDPHGLISDIYEQNTGLLPVNGTQNIYGIINFIFSFSINSAPYSDESIVPNFLSQAVCKTFSLSDGDTYNLKITASDITNNTFSDNRTVHIDASVPEIANIGLVKDGVKRLFVHHQTDLSSMDLQFDAFDQHSGLKTIEWFFGESDNMSHIDSGSIGVSKVNQASISANCFYYRPYRHLW